MLSMPGPIVTEDGEEEFFIDKIVDERNRERGKQYLIRWRGYGPEHDLWRPGREMEDTEALDVWLKRANCIALDYLLIHNLFLFALRFALVSGPLGPLYTLAWCARSIVAEWPTPKNKKEVQSFLGFTNFYQWFIHDFSYHAWPLFDLMAKDVAWTWGSAQQDVFDALKRAITSQPVLIFLDDDHPFRVEADSPDFATGVVLSQQSPVRGHPSPSPFLFHFPSIPFLPYLLLDILDLDVHRSVSVPAPDSHPLRTSLCSGPRTPTSGLRIPFPGYVGFRISANCCASTI
ncbi:putative retrotransposable element tf2 155 kda protein type 1-like [Lyophyllum shimeji]|uniref:Retrotransposable element tf2 155 kDa protein type 1-like n=1 Tax=Lyophyllum shimeji TaxID=47721 RepID=A0A9P3UHU8_LYOSH|nr:putative retrotransposable element tf2 155 kda protein type 1-like [Lyophyllum shimeji]